MSWILSLRRKLNLTLKEISCEKKINVIIIQVQGQDMA